MFVEARKLYNEGKLRNLHWFDEMVLRDTDLGEWVNIKDVGRVPLDMIISEENHRNFLEGGNDSEKRWKQTSMSPEQAEKEYGKENVKVKRGGLRNGDDMVQVFVEGYKVLPPMDKEKYQARDGLEGPFSTLSGKVVYYDPKEGKYYDPDTDMYISYEDFQKLDNDYSDMKEEQIDEGYEGAIIHALQKHDINGFFNKGTLYIEDGADMSTVEEIVNQTVEIAPEIKPEDDYYQMEGIEQSEALTEDQFDEAAGEKDACYRKVKSRYKVWPSAYASGALTKCRKVGAANWGNSKK
jgi:hypothetical protein